MANNFGRVNVSVTASTGGLTAGLASAGKQLAGFREAATTSGDTFSVLNQAGDEAGVIFSDVSGLFGTFASSMISMAKTAGVAAFGVKVLTTAVKALLIPLAVIGAVTAPFKAISNAAGTLDDAGKSAERLGVSVGLFQTLSAVADEVGVNVSSMSSMFTKMQLALVKAADGAKPAIKAFQDLGLNVAALQGMTPGEQFQAIATAIMAIDNPAQRTAAAIAVFGKNAAQSMAFIQAGANGAVAEMQELHQVFGVDITEVQRQGINQMNDALSRLAIPVTGFINQLTAGISPAIATMATLVLGFLKKNADGWGIADAAAKAFTATMRYLSAAVTTLYGMFQLLWGVVMKGESILQKHLVGPMFSFLADWSEAMGAFVTSFENSIRVMVSSLTFLHQQMLKLMASGLEKIGQSGLAKQLRKVADDMANLGMQDSGAGAAIAAKKDDWKGAAKNAADLANVLGKDAGDAIQKGIDNIKNPFQAFDDAMLQQVQKAREEAAKVEDALKRGGDAVKKSVAASSKELKALVVGSTEGEAFRNLLARGGDARTAKDHAAETADNTERAADEIEGLREDMAMNFGLAAIQV